MSRDGLTVGVTAPPADTERQCRHAQADHDEPNEQRSRQQLPVLGSRLVVHQTLAWLAVAQADGHGRCPQ